VTDFWSRVTLSLKYNRIDYLIIENSSPTENRGVEMVNQQQIIDLAILVLSFYFLAGGVLNMDWALKYRSGRVQKDCPHHH